ncbi:MAG: chloromuconate cycloisomerase, partial [Chryseobacterium sp.]|nr:chloromuconate cycloisomerase [Chryseobacterium sp.]
MELHFELKTLQLKETFSIAYGNYNRREALLVELSYLNCKGYGECVAIDYYKINLKDFVIRLKEIQGLVEKKTIIHPTEFFLFLSGLNMHPFLK